jgi:uncharacterized protein YcbX
MGESQGAFNQGPGGQEIRDEYLQALGFPPEAELGGKISHGLEFLEDHMRDPGPPPVPSKAALDEIRRVSEQLRADIEVTGLSYYPIKSCGAVEASQVTFSAFGIKHDREWMLVGSKGQFLSQRTHPELALVQGRIEDGSLIASAPGMGELAVGLEKDPDAEVVPVNLWKKPGTGTNEGTDASGYFSEYLGKDARLLRVEQPRLIKPECRVDGASEQTGFADGFPILLASTDSLAKLNGHLEQPVTVDRFRPNIVVEGAPAYDEDYWREVCIGELRAFVVRACARCPVPNVDQQVGELPKVRPVTEALRATRQGVDPIGGEKGEFFGQNIVHVFEPGVTIRVGDTVSVIERAGERNFQPLQ